MSPYFDASDVILHCPLRTSLTLLFLPRKYTNAHYVETDFTFLMKAGCKRQQLSAKLGSPRESRNLLVAWNDEKIQEVEERVRPPA